MSLVARTNTFHHATILQERDCGNTTAFQVFKHAQQDMLRFAKIYIENIAKFKNVRKPYPFAEYFNTTLHDQ